MKFLWEQDMVDGSDEFENVQGHIQKYGLEGEREGVRSRPLPSPRLPLPVLSPSCPLPFPSRPLPLEVGPLNPAVGLGECCKLPQRGLG